MQKFAKINFGGKNQQDHIWCINSSFHLNFQNLVRINISNIEIYNNWKKGQIENISASLN